MTKETAAQRTSVSTVERLHPAVADAPVVEEMILKFIAYRYGAKSLSYLSHVVTTGF